MGFKPLEGLGDLTDVLFYSWKSELGISDGMAPLGRGEVLPA